MHVKVMNLNIWHGGRVWDNALDFIKREDPDILLLQEAYNGSDPQLEPRYRTIGEFATLLQFTDYDFAPTMNEIQPFGKVVQGNAIFSKFPISRRYEPRFFNEPFHDAHQPAPEHNPTTPRNLQQVAIATGDTELNIFNFQGVWDLDGDNDSPQRQRMVQLILDATQGLSNVIISGDTNARPTNPSMQRLAAQFTDVFAGELSTTFNLARKDLNKFPGYADSVVDMLFVSPHLKVMTHNCPQVDISDHLPLIAELDLY